MKLYSTRRQSPAVSWREAIFRGLPPDNGLYLPEQIPTLAPDFFQHLAHSSLADIATVVGATFLHEEVPLADLEKIAAEAFTFDAPLVPLGGNNYVLELFHGPTLAFKDFGARFMARLMQYFLQQTDEQITVLVATSGDTGSAVAQGFYGVAGIRVVILYPSGQVSPVQEKQLTTVGGNVTALEVAGTFDDCQRMVKEAFLDKALSEKLRLTSANSINIARLLPQSFYYFYAYGQLLRRRAIVPGESVVFSVPSGNFGNLCAGLLAKKMGLPLARMVAATNVNDVVPAFLRTHLFQPRPSVPTLSNAMDVGNPSNFARMLALYDEDAAALRAELTGFAYTDVQTSQTLHTLFESTGYLADPHTAIGWQGLQDNARQHSAGAAGVCLATAHPAKFGTAVARITGQPVALPPALAGAMARPKVAVPMEKSLEALRDWLLSATAAGY